MHVLNIFGALFSILFSCLIHLQEECTCSIYIISLLLGNHRSPGCICIHNCSTVHVHVQYVYVTNHNDGQDELSRKI